MPNQFLRHKTPTDGSLCAYDKFYPEITDAGVNDLYCLTEIVKNSHFLYITDSYLLEDMEGGALVKMLEFIKSGNFDPSRGNLKNVLYTMCRNEMKNAIYRSNKATPVEDEVMTKNEAPLIIVGEDAISIDDSLFDKYTRISQVDKDKVKSSLRYLGFKTSSNEAKWYPEVERWLVFFIWRRLK